MTRPTRFARGFTLSIAECFFPPSLGACSQARGPQAHCEETDNQVTVNPQGIAIMEYQRTLIETKHVHCKGSRQGVQRKVALWQYGPTPFLRHVSKIDKIASGEKTFPRTLPTGGCL